MVCKFVWLKSEQLFMFGMSICKPLSPKKLFYPRRLPCKPSRMAQPRYWWLLMLLAGACTSRVFHT